MENVAPPSWFSSYLAPLGGVLGEHDKAQAGPSGNDADAGRARDLKRSKSEVAGPKDALPGRRHAFGEINGNAAAQQRAADGKGGLGKTAAGLPKAAGASAGPQDHVAQHQYSDPAPIDDKRRRDWIDVDAQNADDPQAVPQYAQAIFTHLREAQLHRRPSLMYLESVQKDVNAKMRAILVDWLVEVAEEYKLCADTLYLTINFIDRFLSLHEVQRSQLQLVGVACMWIAAKYEEIYPPNVNDFCYITDNTYSREQMVAMEELILKKLNYELTVPTAKTFLRRMLQVCNPDEHLHFLSNYLTEICLLDHNMLQFLPSEIASASVYLSNLILKRQPWDGNLQYYSTHAPRDLAPCVAALSALHQAVTTNTQLNAIREKYAHARFQSVSRLPVIANVHAYLA